MEKIEILGCPCIAANNKEEIKHFIYNNIILEGIGGYSVAINAEKVVLYHRDKNVKEVIDQSVLPTIDGGGITIGLKLLRKKVYPRIDLPRSVLELSNEKQLKVFILGAKEEINKLATKNISKEFAGIQLVGRHHGYFEDDSSIVDLLISTNPHIVLVALGSPRQELLSVKLNKTLEHTLFIGCGGAIDVFAGLTQRPPAFIGDNHLEWLYRLVKKPSRIKRQKRLVVYLLMILRAAIYKDNQ